MPLAIRTIDRLDELAGDVTLASVARGDVLYRGAAKWNNLAPGTSGRFLQTLGAGADPAWSDVDHGLLTGLADDDHTQYTVIAPASSTRNLITPTGATFIPLVIQGAAAQSGDLLRFQDNTPTILTRVTSAGFIGVGIAPTLRFHSYAAAGGSDNLGRFEVGDSGGVFVSVKNTTRVWVFGQNSAEEFIIRDSTGGNIDCVRIAPGAPISSIYVTAAGRMGIGHAAADCRLDVVSEAVGTPTIRSRKLASQTANLYEATDEAEAILFAIEADGDLRTSRATAATTPGSVTNKLAIYNAAGTLIGYIPIYDAIT